MALPVTDSPTPGPGADRDSSTPYYGPIWAILSKLYDWDLRNFQNLPKLTKTQPFFDFFILLKTVHTIRTKFCTVILHHIWVLYVQFY